MNADKRTGGGGAKTDTQRLARERAAELQERLGFMVIASTSNDWLGAYAIVDFASLAALCGRLTELENAFAWISEPNGGLLECRVLARDVLAAGGGSEHDE